LAGEPDTVHTEKSYSRLARSGIYWSYLRVGIFAFVTVPTTVVLARTLTPTQFGIAAGAIYFGQLASRLAGAGMGTALIRLKTLRPEHVSSVFVVNGIVSLSVSLLLLAAGPYIGAFFRNAEVGALMPVVALTFAISVLDTCPRALLQRDMRFPRIATVNTLDMLTAPITAVGLAWGGFGVWSLPLGELAGASARSVAALLLARWVPTLRFSREALGEVLSFGLGSYAKRVMDHATLNLDNVVVGRTLGVTALGFYDKAFMLMNRVVNHVNLAGPGISFRIFAIIQEDEERFRRAYRKVIMSVALIGIPAFASLAVSADELFLVAFGERWLPSVLPFRILCAVGVLKLLNAYASSAAQARGWIWSEVWRQIVYVFLIVMGIVAAGRWGIVGAAAAVLVATAVMFVLMQHMLLRATGLGPRDVVEPVLPAVACAAWVAAAALAAELLLRGVERRWLVLLAQLGAAAVTYVLFLWLTRAPDVRDLVQELRDDFSRRLRARADKSATVPPAASGVPQ
jgi:O-antigen/teichoic acid export membrane protein